MQSGTKKPQGQIKYTQHEQYSQLLAKQASETELLEDLRSYCKQRAVLDREYGQSLQKLCNSFLGKKEYISVQNTPGRKERSVWDIWKSFLLASNQLAVSRIQASDEHQRLCLDLKSIKSARTTVSKRTFEQLKSLQNDLASAVQEMVKSRKIYSEEEKQAHDTRVKAQSAEERIRRRSTNLFSSMAQLQRTHAKLSSRRQECENRSTSARNEYIFQLTALNAHLNHYLKKDIPDMAKTLDGDVYEKFREVLVTSNQTELDICRSNQGPFKELFEASAEINRTNAWNQFIQESPVFLEDLQFKFEPRAGDTVTGLLSLNAKDTSSANGGDFEQLAKKLARHFVSRERRIKAYEEEISDLRSGRITPPPGQVKDRKYFLKGTEVNGDDALPSPEYMEHKLEELEFAIRREEIEKSKNEACLDLLKRSGVDIQAALNEAYQFYASAAAATAASEVAGSQHSSYLAPLAPLNNNTATGSSTEDSTVGAPDIDGRQRPSSNGTSSRMGSPRPLGNGHATHGSSNNRTHNGKPRVSADAWSRTHPTDRRSSDRDPSAVAPGSLSALNVDEVDSAAYRRAHSEASVAEIPEPDWLEDSRLPKATALYEYLSTRPDELDLVVNEKVVLLGDGDGEHWVKVRSLIDGKEGLVPRNFLAIDPPTLPEPSVLAPPLSSTSVTSSSVSTPAVANATLRPPDEERSRTASNDEGRPYPHSVSASSQGSASALNNSHPPMSQCTAGQFVRALISFVGSQPDELNFSDGDVLHVLGRPAADVDDGWLEGELVPPAEVPVDKICRGVFPSMLVQPVPADEAVKWAGLLETARVRLGRKSSAEAPALLAEDEVLMTSLGITTASTCPSDVKRHPSSSSGSVPASRTSVTAAPTSGTSHSKGRSTLQSSTRSSSGRRSHSRHDEHSSSRGHQQQRQQRSSHRRSQQQQQQHQGTPNGHLTAQPVVPATDEGAEDADTTVNPNVSSASHVLVPSAPAVALTQSTDWSAHSTNGSVADPEIRIAEV